MDELELIRKIIEAHHTIRQQVKQAGGEVVDLEAVFSLRESSAGWALASLEALSEKRNHLKEVLGILDQGLHSHFKLEEGALPPLLGALLTRALILEHNKVRGEMEQAQTACGVKLEGLNQQELLSQKWRLQRTVEQLCQTIEQHATREEVVLRMMESALLDKVGKAGQTA
ncbi:MAG: hypothetical protein V1849_00480 [Chloroflexota bacterium]